MASQSFVWWVDLTTDVLMQLLNEIHDVEAELSSVFTDLQGDDYLVKIPPILASSFDSLNTILAIPWFSSNWTLREIMLCSNITILNREGDSVHMGSKTPTPATIDMIVRLCSGILVWLQLIEREFRGTTLAASAIPGSENLRASSVLRSSAHERPVSVSVLVECCLNLVKQKAAFFLYSNSPSTLNHWTKALLETGALVIEGKAGSPESVHGEACWELYHGWGEDYRLECSCVTICGCPSFGMGHAEDFCQILRERATPVARLCIPCLLGVSYTLRSPIGQSSTTVVTAQTKISSRLNENDRKQRLGPDVVTDRTRAERQWEYQGLYQKNLARDRVELLKPAEELKGRKPGRWHLHYLEDELENRQPGILPTLVRGESTPPSLKAPQRAFVDYDSKQNFYDFDYNRRNSLVPNLYEDYIDRYVKSLEDAKNEIRSWISEPRNENWSSESGVSFEAEPK